MVVLKAIGRFFAKIGRWIRDTAWVQPLLIVGGIFAIIFSIPPITKAIKNANKESDAALAYYKKNALSWKGVEKDGVSCDVEKLFAYLENPDDPNNKTYANKFGRKFFVNFVQEGCTGCKSNYYGFKTAQDNWGKSEFAFEGEKEAFKSYSIFIDAEDDDDEICFTKYISGNKASAEYNDIFQDASDIQTPYKDNVGGGDSYYESLFSEENTFQSPTCFLVDLDGPGYTSTFGISEIFFEFSGKNGDSTAWGKARTVWDCWNHQGIFSVDYKK